jgi:HEAT repeat protein
VKPVPVPAVIVDNLLVALDDANDRVRFEAIHALGALSRPPLTVPQTRKLTAALDHYDPIVRAASARVIARLQVKEAEDALITATNDSNQAVRQFAMYALGELKSQKAVAALTNQVKNYRSNVQATFALLALAKIAHPSSADLFRQYLAAKDPGHRAASAEGLARVGAKDYVPQIEQRLEAERGPAVRLAYFFALHKLGRNSLEQLVMALQDDGAAPQASEYLIELGPPVAKALAPYLTAREPNIRGRVAELLGLIGGPDVLQALESARLDQNEAVARAVAAAIERIKARS